MWSIRCSFTRVQSYADAVRTWKNGVLFSKSKSDDLLAPRGLVDRRKKHLAVQRTEAGDIVLRLYDHPVVTWHKDNSFTLDLYSSLSTSKFANHCTPGRVYVSCGKYRTSSVSINGLCYNASKPVTFEQRDGKWKAKDRSQLTPWSVSVVNRARAKQALAESGYNDFRLWLTTYVQMVSPPIEHGYTSSRSEQIVSLLRERKWRELVTRQLRNTPDNWKNPDRMLHDVRQAIYREYDCIDEQSVPFLG